jgi:hypothetical protein
MEDPMHRLSTRVITLAAGLSVLFIALERTAQAQNFSNDAIAHCAQVVGQIKFEGWPADRNREMMMLACESNGGQIPGATQGSSVSLPRHSATVVR